MNGTRWPVVLGFVVALGAGAVLGVAQDRVRNGGGRESWLAAQLDLTPEQQEQIRQVWSEVMSQHGKAYREQRDQLRVQRDAMLRELLNDEQRVRHDAIVAEFERRLEDLGKQKAAAIESAIERTKQLLSPEQRRRYEELLLNKDQWPDHAGPGRRDVHGRGEKQGR